MIQYEQFYRQFGVREPGQLLQPPLPVIGRFELPPMSLVHYPGSGPLDAGPNDQGLMYQKNTKPLRIEHVFNFASTLGNPKRIQADTMSEVRKFREKNPRFRPMLDLAVQKRDTHVIGTYNYAFLMRMFRFQRTLFTLQNRLTNVTETMFKQIGANIGSGYNQYLELNIPETLPTFESLRLASNGWNSKTVRIFTSPELILILELHKWLGEGRRSSAFYKYIGENPTGVHLVLRAGDRFTIIDLERLNRWRKSTGDEMKLWAEESIKDPSLPKPNVKGVDPLQVQKRFLRLLMSVSAARIQDTDENIGDESLQSAIDSSETPSDDAATPQANQNDEAEAFTGNTYEIDDLNLQAIVDDDIDMLDEINASFLKYTGPEDKEELDRIDGVLPEDSLSTDPSTAANVLDAPVETVGNVAPIELFPTDPAEAFERLLIKAADAGNITAAEYRKLLDMNKEFGNIPAPLDFEGSLEDFINVTEEMTAITEAPSIPDRTTVIDKSMLKSSLLDFNARYSKQLLLRDMLGAICNLRSGGLIIKDIRVELVENIADANYYISVDVKPIVGAQTTWMIKCPVVDEEGNFKIGLTKYRTRMQRGDWPLRKVGPSRVALTSNYGKLFVDRSEKRTSDYGKWLRAAIRAQGLSSKTDIITKIVPGRAFENKEIVPRLFSTLSLGFRGFTFKVNDEFFTVSLTASKAEKITFAGQGELTTLGVSESGSKLLLDTNSVLYLSKGGSVEILPTIEQLLGLNPLKAPVESAEISVFGQSVSIGVALGYLLGFEASLKFLGVKQMRVVPTGKRLNLTPGEWPIVFDDETLILNRSDEVATLALAGWKDFDQTTSRFQRAEFSKKDIYFNLFEEKKLSIRYVNELDNLERLFVEPIARELLIKMKEPIIFTELLRRSCELLATDTHPDEQDAALMRERGYERFANFAYSEIIRSYRIHNSRPGKHRFGIDLHPYAVHNAIQKDPAKDQIAEINPIQNLKEIESVTYSGTGGRGGRSMVKSTRVFHENDKGIASESTVDSSNVAINIFYTANPQLDSLRGTHKPFDYKEAGPTGLLSTSALISPGSTRDDPKRVNFIGIQNRHVVPCAAYQQPLIRTGYEQVIPYRVGDLFAVMAKQDGKVVSRTPTGIIIEYADGSRTGVELGRRYGNAAGLTIPHNVTSDLDTGQVFKEGDPIAYNTGFFERDALNPKQIIYKTSMMCKIALMESPGTLEDSSEISASLARRLSAEQTKIKDIIVEFGQEIHQMVKLGAVVTPESILCTIEDELSARAGLLDQESMDTLRVMDSQTPLAKINGTVERIEIYYNGEIEDMSDSLRELVQASDERIIARRMSSDQRAFSGSVGDDFRIGADPLLMDTACIQIWMTSNVASGIGDKGVFFNQMKTVFGRVFNDDIFTEDGQKIDVVFGQVSIDNRIVGSPPIIGTSTTLLMEGSQRVVRAYRGIPQKKPLKAFEVRAY